MDNVLESYLIKLGFAPDISGLRQFQDVLKQAERAVDEYSSGMLQTLLKAQIGITSAFVSTSAAIITMADKLAMADQSYRLFGLRMNMTMDTARKVTMIMDGLGASLEEIIWDPELHERAVLMAHDIDRMTEALGPDFEQKMRRVRDMRFEFTRMGVALKFLGMQTVSSLMDKLGLDQGKLDEWVSKFQQNIPHMAEVIANVLGPVLKDTWHLLMDMKEGAETFLTIFTNLIGTLSGDTSIEGTAFSLENLAKAFSHIISWADAFVEVMLGAEKTLLHFILAAERALHLDFSGAVDELTKGFETAFDTISQHPLMSGLLAGAPFGPAGLALGGGIGAALQLMATSAPAKDEELVAKKLDSGGATVTGAAPPSAEDLKKYPAPTDEDRRITSPEYQEQLLRKSQGTAAVATTAELSKSPTSPASVDSIVAYMAKREGFYKAGSLAQRNNNPGNLVYAGQRGATRGAGGFARFNTPEEGFEEAKQQILLDARRGTDAAGNPVTNLDQLVHSWTKTEQDSYLRGMVAATGINPAAPLSSITSSGAKSVTFNGGINIHVNQPGASADQIAYVVKDKLQEHFDSLNIYDMNQLTPAGMV